MPSAAEWEFYMKIAIDGPAGAGKSTISKSVAKKLGYIYIDTGAMYRAAGLAALRAGIDIKAQPELAAENTEKISIDIRHGENGQEIYLCGENVTDKIRTEEVSMAASDIAVIASVRARLVSLQRAMAENSSVVMDGRDIGTHVLPDAECKIFLTASAYTRGERRYKELREKGVDCSLDDICRDILARDKNDTEREESPLREAEDAIVVDTTELALCESIEKVLDIIKAKTEY